MSAHSYDHWLKEQSFPKFKHGESFVFLGSCFSDELGNIIRTSGFESLVNPGGTIFHPLAIAKLIEWSFDESISFRTLQHEDIFFSWELAGSVFGMSVPFHHADHSLDIAAVKLHGSQRGAVLPWR